MQTGSACTAQKDCGNHFTTEGCLIRVNNLLYKLSSDESGFKQTYVDGRLKDEKMLKIPNAAEWDISGYLLQGNTIDLVTANQMYADNRVCTKKPLLCAEGGECAPAGTLSAKIEVAAGCLARNDDGIYLLDKDTQSYASIPQASSAWYDACMESAPKMKDGTVLGAFCADPQDCPELNPSWAQFYCKNAAPCLEDDVPGGVELTDAQKVRSYKDKNKPEMIENICAANPRLCSQFTENAVPETMCRNKPLECAYTIVDPASRCDHLPQTLGCPYLPPAPSKDDIRLSRFDEKRESAARTFQWVLWGGLALIVAIAIAVGGARFINRTKIAET